MILRRLILALVAAAMLAAGASVCVVALAFALYALVAPQVGAAGASAIVAGVAALLIILCGLILSLAVRPKRVKTPPTPAGITDRVIGFLREKPVLAIAGALATGFLAVRNPGYLGAAVRAFMEGREGRRR